MDLQQRNNVRILGRGSTTLVLVHGFGCDQNMWRLLVPGLAEEYRVVLLDLTGCGRSHAPAYEPGRYATLHGYASDVAAIIEEFAEGPTVLVGHSVSAMIGVLVERTSPGLLAAHVMVGPSACYLNDADYQGGFSRDDIDELLATLEGNFLGWSSQMAPLIMGAPDRPELSDELASSFCRTDPDIAAQFARVTFLSDHREDVLHIRSPALVLQSTDDIIAPLSAGRYVASVVPGAVLSMIDNIGHCPHLSAPEACLAAIQTFLRENALGA